jgi:hypothetical protein
MTSPSLDCLSAPQARVNTGDFDFRFRFGFPDLCFGYRCVVDLRNVRQVEHDTGAAADTADEMFSGRWCFVRGTNMAALDAFYSDITHFLGTRRKLT